MRVTIHQTRPKDYSPLSSLICWLQNTNYSHYIIEVSDNLIIHATRRGVHYQAFSSFLKSNDVVQSIHIHTTLTLPQVGDFCNKHLGKRYGFMQIFGLALRSLRIIKNNPFGRGKKLLTCTELVVLFLIEVYNIEISNTDNYDLVKTENLIWRCLNANHID